MVELKRLPTLGRDTFVVHSSTETESQFQRSKPGYLRTILITLWAWAEHMTEQYIAALVVFKPLERAYNALIASGVQLTVAGQDLNCVGNVKATANRPIWIPPQHLTEEQVTLCREHYAARLLRNACLIHGQVHVFEHNKSTTFVPVTGQVIEADIVQRSVPGTDRILWIATDFARAPMNTTAVRTTEEALVAGRIAAATTARGSGEVAPQGTPAQVESGASGEPPSTGAESGGEQPLTDEEIQALELENSVATS